MRYIRNQNRRQARTPSLLHGKLSGEAQRITHLRLDQLDLLHRRFSRNRHGLGLMLCRRCPLKDGLVPALQRRCRAGRKAVGMRKLARALEPDHHFEAGHLRTVCTNPGRKQEPNRPPVRCARWSSRRHQREQASSRSEQRPLNQPIEAHGRHDSRHDRLSALVILRRLARPVEERQRQRNKSDLPDFDAQIETEERKE